MCIDQNLAKAGFDRTYKNWQTLVLDLPELGPKSSTSRVLSKIDLF